MLICFFRVTINLSCYLELFRFLSKSDLDRAKLAMISRFKVNNIKTQYIIEEEPSRPDVSHHVREITAVFNNSYYLMNKDRYTWYCPSKTNCGCVSWH